MLEIIHFSHGKQPFYLLFLVGMLLCFTIYPSFCSKLNTTSCFERDRQFLQDLNPGCTNHYNRTYSHDCCNWPGISCSNLTGRVIDLDLSTLLYGCYYRDEGKLISLGPSLVSLENLVSLYLDLGQVSFTKGFPSFIASFPNLRHIYLFSDEVQAIDIPLELGNLTRLETIEVSSDSMLSKTLSMISHLTSLKRLVLNYVILSQATDWLHVVSNLPHLEHLDLSNCHLPNAISPSKLSVNSSKSLSYLDLSFNNLETSSSWSWVFNHSSLSHLDLSYNKLEGRLPSSLEGLCGLRNFKVSQNHRLQGDVSSIFQSLSCAKGSLTEVYLQKNLFSGSMPDFSTFSSLRKLVLHSNRLNGSLPSYFGKPSSLVLFDAHNNQLTGSIPDLSAFGSLKVLKLQNNKLNGSMHPGIGQLPNLRHLDISSNSLEGDIGIAHLANLSSLRYLDISFNSLTLKVGSSWVPPFRLDSIGLASCDVGSQFPQWLRTQTNYSRLDMSNSGIFDTIPFWFWNLSSIATFISLSHNRLHGKLPTDLSIVYYSNPAIDLSFNSLEGNIPPFFENSGYLNVSRNIFSGHVSFLCDYMLAIDPSSNYMGGIDLSHNNFSGKLPDCWCKFEFMSVLDLSSNSFSGQLPSSLGNLPSLQSLHLRNNMFSGILPLSFCELTNLLYLDLGDNLFSGEIPGCLGHKLNNLTVLSLRNNSISGIIPPELCQPSIQILDLSMNNISGVIPKCLCNLQAMTLKKSLPVVMYIFNETFSTADASYKDYISLVLKGYLYNDGNHLELVKSLDLSSNSLGGEIPDEISCLTGLINLNFSGNNLTGSITSKIGSLKSLESLDLSNNHLSGVIPSTIAELNFLGTMSLANNNLSGKIPTGTQIQGFDASTFAGNPALCGEPLPNKCPGDEHGDDKVSGANVDDQNPKDDNNTLELGLYISIALGIFTGFWGVCGVLGLKRSWRIAYFRFWMHAYDRLYVFVTLKVVRLQR